MRCIKATHTPADCKTSYEDVILCEFEDGSSHGLMFYGDELHIRPEDCIGKTWEQIRKMRHDMDVAYLQSP